MTLLCILMVIDSKTLHNLKSGLLCLPMSHFKIICGLFKVNGFVFPTTVHLFYVALCVLFPNSETHISLLNQGITVMREWPLSDRNPNVSLYMNYCENNSVITLEPTHLQNIVTGTE